MQMADIKKANEFEKLMASLSEETDKLCYVTFLANLDLIKAYLEKGYTAKSIWKSLSQTDIISFSYVTFTKYLKKHHLKPSVKTVQSDSISKESKGSYLNDGKQVNDTATAQKGEIAKIKLPDGMSHNPMINPKDLY
jgi:Family of unknown function (DUF5338)